jgi:phosphoribosylformylglycinamidine cyclo-ligase
VARVTYKDSGVDIEAGNQAIRRIKDGIQSTYSKNVLTELGSFGGMFRMPEGLDKPVLVSSADGVGTKLKVAVLAGKHDTVGEDLVNHCVNDIAVGGAKPLFFLDYFACDKLDQDVFAAVIDGFVRGCRNNGCALIGGETAEMPDMYQKGEYDISGTIVGVVEQDKIINGSNIAAGDVLIGVESNGLHTNGYSLARRALLTEYKVTDHVTELGHTIGDELLRVHRSYLPLISELTDKFVINGISHITGGGIIGNTRRLLREGLQLYVNWNSWETPAIFRLIGKLGDVPEDDMRATFNLGIGLVLIVSPDQADTVLAAANRFAPSQIIGEVR